MSSKYYNISSNSTHKIKQAKLLLMPIIANNIKKTIAENNKIILQNNKIKFASN